ncbi:MAG: hypothetical protein ACI4TK_03805 [Agathobacter sp.]
MIDSGEKTEEYRPITPYYIKKLCDVPIYDNEHTVFLLDRTKVTDHYINTLYDRIYTIADSFMKGLLIPKEFTHVCFHRGYSKTTMTFSIKEIDVDFGEEMWGGNEEYFQFVIILGERI